MFYYASKIVWFFLTPSNLLTSLIVVGLILTYSRRERAGKTLVMISAAGFVVAGLSPLGNALILPLEERFPVFVDNGQPVTGIVILGGTLDSEATNQRRQMALNETGERILAIGDLARRYPNARIIYSGGGSEFTPDTTPEATLVEQTVSALGIPKSRVEYERRSLNTSENALYSKAIAGPKAGERWLLVTSAFHMARSVGVFRKAGFDVIAHPVDFRTAGWRSLLRPFGFVGEGLRRTDIAAKEWIGLFVYYVTGKSDEFLSRPKPSAPHDNAIEHSAQPG